MENRINQFKQAIAQPFKSAMFDFDGTLCVSGTGQMSEEMMDVLAELCMERPLAICSGRLWEGMLPKMEPIFARAKDPELARSNWYYCLESGTVGYRYNRQKRDYERFYEFEGKWNELKVKVMEEAKREFPKITDDLVFIQGDFNFEAYIRAGRDVAHLTAQMARAAEEFLKKIDPLGTLHVIDSGIAVHILPKEAHKGRGILEFGNLLGLEAPYKDLLLIGDQPQRGGNDEQFLEGKWGVPFTTENLGEGLQPNPVFNEKDERLTGPTATLELLRRVHFT